MKKTYEQLPEQKKEEMQQIKNGARDQYSLILENIALWPQ